MINLINSMLNTSRMPEKHFQKRCGGHAPSPPPAHSQPLPHPQSKCNPPPKCLTPVGPRSYIKDTYKRDNEKSVSVRHFPFNRATNQHSQPKQLSVLYFQKSFHDMPCHWQANTCVMAGSIDLLDMSPPPRSEVDSMTIDPPAIIYPTGHSLSPRGWGLIEKSRTMHVTYTY